MTTLESPRQSDAVRETRAGERPVFIIGCERSGTTLLRAMLNEHSRVAIPPEAHRFSRMIRDPSPWERVWNREAAARVLGEFLSRPKMARWEVGHAAAVAELDGLAEVRFSDLIRAVYRAYARRHGKARWGDKTPHNTFDLSQMIRGFPDARVIHLVRDGRDVRLSWAKVDWTAHYTTAQAAKQWVKWVRAASDIARTLEARHYLEVRYEELVQRPEETLRRVCACIGESFEPRMLDYHTAGYSRLAGAREAAHRLLNTRPDVTRVAVWRREMPADEVKMFERLAGSTLIAFGYPVSRLTRVRLAVQTLVRPIRQVATRVLTAASTPPASRA